MDQVDLKVMGKLDQKDFPEEVVKTAHTVSNMFLKRF